MGDCGHAGLIVSSSSAQRATHQGNFDDVTFYTSSTYGLDASVVTKAIKVKKRKPPLSIVGWMEHIDLPDLGLHSIKAKFDTGARTSALHASNIQTFDRDGENWVRFDFVSSPDAPAPPIEARIYDTRHIKNTSGIPEKRIVIRTTLVIAQRSWPISVSLTDRRNMRLPMIVGRSALKRQNIAVHTRGTKLTAKKDWNNA